MEPRRDNCGAKARLLQNWKFDTKEIPKICFRSLSLVWSKKKNSFPSANDDYKIVFQCEYSVVCLFLLLTRILFLVGDYGRMKPNEKELVEKNLSKRSCNPCYSRKHKVLHFIVQIPNRKWRTSKSKHTANKLSGWILKHFRKEWKNFPRWIQRSPRRVFSSQEFKNALQGKYKKNLDLGDTNLLLLFVGDIFYSRMNPFEGGDDMIILQSHWGKINSRGKHHCTFNVHSTHANTITIVQTVGFYALNLRFVNLKQIFIQ